MFFKNKVRQRVKTRKFETLKTRKIFLKILVFFVILLFAYYSFIFGYKYLKIYMSNNDLFKIKAIKIIHNSKIYRVNYFDSFYLRNIFSINSSVEEKRIIKNFRKIESVRIKKIYPSTLIFDVKFRKILFFMREDNKIYLLDKYGISVNIKNKYENVIEISDNIFKNKKMFLNIKYFVLYLRKFNYIFYKEIKYLDISKNNQILIYLKNDVVVNWGIFKKNYIETKLKYLSIVINDLYINRKSFNLIDLRNFKNSDDFILVKEKGK